MFPVICFALFGNREHSGIWPDIIWKFDRCFYCITPVDSSKQKNLCIPWCVPVCLVLMGSQRFLTIHFCLHQKAVPSGLRSIDFTSSWQGSSQLVYCSSLKHNVLVFLFEFLSLHVFSIRDQFLPFPSPCFWKQRGSLWRIEFYIWWGLVAFTTPPSHPVLVKSCLLLNQ